MRLLVLVCAIALVGCGDKMTPEEKAAKEARDIALVERVNATGAVVPITPQPILFPDMEEYDLFRTNCAFVDEGGGVGAVALAMQKDGFMKLENKLVRFAADNGSPELPLGAHSRYDGKKYAFELALDRRNAKQAGAEETNYPGRLTVRDGGGNVVYDKPGQIQCGN